ncbi:MULTISPECIES: hypothetical protein [Enterococcus]|uniref:hypothetical protein n=1 Tax=Enterococcus TaxID=1350 RepID=UPI000F813485|nr:hypothetical protein [Enterococcus faecalis]EGO9144820.1 hypothetical protein [Enterococcus faecalis]MCK8459208.1 hypothetical protein [Enterococcus faecalis]MDM3965189.1 hypothetical protein [Enterococcus faecalis]QJC67962.1 hypothetical protein GRB94_10020 [Enterococcus faecalis]RTK11027.1 hypothetical protein DRJ95_11090 [Enterococcus faecalis]
MKVKSLRRLAVVLVAFASGVLLGKGNSEFWISLLQLVAVLFIFSYDLAIEDRNIKRKKRFQEIKRKEFDI